MSSRELKSFSSELFTILLCPFWNQPAWLSFKAQVETLAKCFVDYCDYLDDKNKRIKLNHSALIPVRQLSDNMSISLLPSSNFRSNKLDELNSALSASDVFTVVDVGDFCPSDPNKKYKFIQKAKKGHIPEVDLLAILTSFGK